MRKSKVEINFTMEERQKLEETVRTRTAPYRAVQRARLILLAAEGMENKAISREVGLSRSMVARWHQRFADSRIEGLEDAPRSGKKPRYGRDTERRILALPDTDPRLPDTVVGLEHWLRVSLGMFLLTTSGG